MSHGAPGTGWAALVQPANPGALRTRNTETTTPPTVQGVPKFYRWLSERFPLINQNIEDDSLLLEFDNLYMDLNGVIHNASHGNEGITRRKADDTIARACCATIDGIVKKMRPTQLIYMAVDGCAPRAKQNQQRSRRTRSAKDAREARREAEAAGETHEDEDVFDSNCITPGTPFMDMINKAMKQFVIKQLKEDPAWQGRKVIFSGSNVPGEGEHKIVEFIRGLQSQGAAANPNLRHCMVGLDADLIMLSLAMHQPHFSLLREHIDFTSFRTNKNGTKTKTRQTSDVQWQLLHIGLLREYLEIDMKPDPAALAGASFTYDGERVIDDFVLLTVLCGNDFVPHLPSLDIGEGAMDVLMQVYKEQLPAMGGYLVDKGTINFDRLQVMLDIVSAMEPEVFKQRAKDAERFAERQARDGARDAKFRKQWSLTAHEPEDLAELAELAVSLDPGDGTGSEASSALASASSTGGGAAGGDADSDGGSWHGAVEEDTGVDPAVRALMPLTPGVSASIAAKAAALAASTPESDIKTRYYYSKMGIGPGIPGSEAVKASMVKAFAEALQWVMLYYYQGVPSWGWFYPFHYAPMTSDLVGLSALEINFELGQPFRPFLQLLATLPADSAQFLPRPFQWLMTSPDSPIADFYPDVDDVRLDANGKRSPWEAVTLVPFIDEARLLEAVEAHAPDSSLSASEQARNRSGDVLLLQFDPSVSTTAVSESTAFPDIPRCNVSIQEPYVQPALPPGVRFNPLPPAGCIIPAPGYPTLHALPLSAAFKKVKLNIFGFGSRKHSTILTPHGAAEPGTAGTHVPVFSTAYAPGTSVQATSSLMPPVPEEGFPRDLYIDLQHMELREAADALLGRCVYVEYPHLRAAQVVAVSSKDAEATWYPSGSPHVVAAARHGESKEAAGGTQVISAYSSQQSVKWMQDVQQMLQVLEAGGRGLAQCGLCLEPPKLVLRVRKLVGMCREPRTGALHRVFARPVTGRPPGDAALIAGSSLGEVLVPGTCVLRDHPHPDARWVEHGPLTLEDRFPVGREVVVVRGPHRGVLGKVEGHDGDKLVIQAPPKHSEAQFGRAIAQQVQDQYFSAGQIAKLLKISPAVLAKVTGSVMVKPGMYDLGLNFKIWGGSQYLPGYVMSVGKSAKAQAAWASGAAQSVSVARGRPKDTSGPWVFTERAVAAVAAYQKKFPAIFEYMAARPNAPSYTPKQIGGIRMVEAAVKWLHQLDSYPKALVDLSTIVLSPIAVASIEKAADTLNAVSQRNEQSKPEEFAPRTIGTVYPSDVYAREEKGFAVAGVGGGEGVAGAGADARPGSSGTPPTLGDRVMNLAFPHAPMGLRGVVIATHASSGYVEVVFDEAFLGGTSLSGICSPGRGALVQWNELLCLDAPASATASSAPTAGAARGWETAAPLIDQRRAAAKAAAEAGPVPLPAGKKGRKSKGKVHGSHLPVQAAPEPAAVQPGPAAAKAKKGKKAKQKKAAPAGKEAGQSTASGKVGTGRDRPAGKQPPPAAVKPAPVASSKELVARLTGSHAGQSSSPPAAAAQAEGAVSRSDIAKVCAMVAAILSPSGLAQPVNAQVKRLVEHGAGWVPLAGLLRHPMVASLKVAGAVKHVHVFAAALKVLVKDKLEVHPKMTAVRPRRAAAQPPVVPDLGGTELPPAAQGQPAAPGASALSGLLASAGSRSRRGGAEKRGMHQTLHQALRTVGGVEADGAVDQYAEGPPEPSGPRRDRPAKGFTRQRKAAAAVPAARQRLKPSALLAAARAPAP